MPHASPPPDPPGVSRRAQESRTAEACTECRCACGSLLGRMTDEGLELKCRRCKRVVVIRLAGALQAPGGWREAVSIHRGAA